MIRALFIILFSISLLMIACSKKEEGLNMKEGKWEITFQMEATGKLPFQMPPQTFTQCITKKNVIPQNIETNKDCKVIKEELKGDTVAWSMECQTPDGPFFSEGTVTYKGTSFDGVGKMKHSGVEITQKMSGKWIGECK